MDFLSHSSWLGRFFNLVFDLVALHIIFLICSIPIFTIGASTTALYYALMIRTRTDEGYIWRNFFKSFKENFKQSTIIWLIMLVIGFVLYLDIRIGMSVDGIIGKVMVFGPGILIIPFAFILLYIFPVQAKFENSIKDNLKNAILMSIANLGYTFLMLVIIASYIFILFKSNAFVGLCIFCGTSLLVWILSNFFILIFRKYLPEEYNQDEAKNNRTN